MQHYLPPLLLLFAYLLGSIPFSFLIVRLLRGADIRDHGSGNVGATNVVRSFGRLPGLFAFVLDAGKGYFAVYAASVVTATESWPIALRDEGSPLETRTFWIGACALLAVLGHIFPVWLGFRGGKGVATAGGVFFGVDPWAIGLGLLIFLVVAVVTRYVSAGSIATAAAVPLIMRFVTGQPFWIVIFSIIVALTIIVRHRSNISRIAEGLETRMGTKRDER